MTTSQVVQTDEKLGRFARQQHDWFERVRKGSLDPDKIVHAVHAIIDGQYPADGVEFELTLNFDAPKANPMQMVRSGGGYDPKGWKFTGKKVTGVQTRSFRLVSIGYQSSFEKVIEELKKYGNIPEGQWREAFKIAFPRLDFRGPIGFADASWVIPDGVVAFPFVSTDGVSYFSWTDSSFNGSWRWLAPVCK